MNTLKIVWRGAEKWPGPPTVFLDFFLTRYQSFSNDFFRDLDHLLNLGVTITQEFNPDPSISWVTVISHDNLEKIQEVKTYYQTSIEDKQKLNGVTLEYIHC